MYTKITLGSSDLISIYKNHLLFQQTVAFLNGRRAEALFDAGFNAAFGEVIRCHFHHNLVTKKNFDVILTHFA